MFKQAFIFIFLVFYIKENRLIECLTFKIYNRFYTLIGLIIDIFIYCSCLNQNNVAV